MQTMEYNQKPLNRNIVSLSIISYVVLMLAASISLIIVFDFPGILREPVEVMLSKFSVNSELIIPSYYLFVLSGIAFMFMVLLIHKAIVPKDSTAGILAVVFGVLFGLTSNLGFIRWPFLMDYLSTTFNDPAATSQKKDIIRIIFDSFHNYAGVAIGENFAFWFEGFWTLFISSVFIRREDIFPKYIGATGYILGTGMLIYTLEQFGGAFAFLGRFNLLIHAGFLVWLLAAAILIFKSKTASESSNKLGYMPGTLLAILYLVLLATAYM